MNPKVSVIMCTYNAEKYVQATLQSVLDQSYTDIEVLILDNNSSDRTLELLHKFHDHRIHIFPSQKNIGPYKGLNFLLEKAAGEYVAIQDHDDLWHPDKMAKQIKFLEDHPKYVGCGTKTLMRYEGDYRGFEYFLGKDNYYTIHPSLVFRNDKHYRYPDTIYMADGLFQKQVLCHGEKLIHNIDETLTLHRVRDGASNYSYRRYKFTIKNMKTVFGLHPVWYAVFVHLFELMRKLVYPVLHVLKQGGLIDKIERLPFVLQGYKMRKYSIEDMKKMGFFV